MNSPGYSSSVFEFKLKKADSGTFETEFEIYDRTLTPIPARFCQEDPKPESSRSQSAMCDLTALPVPPKLRSRSGQFTGAGPDNFGPAQILLFVIRGAGRFV